MREFFRSYNNEVLKPALKWSKKHWKGLAVLTVVTYGVDIGWFFREQIKDKVEEVVDEIKAKF